MSPTAVAAEEPVLGELVLRYQAEVVAVGPMVAEFREQGVVVLFAEGAPEELHEFCVLTRPVVTDGGPVVGGVVRLDEAELPVLAVGDVVEANLLGLGHLDLKADGAAAAALPGDVCVPEGPLPELAPGSVISILAPAAGRGPA